jgi:hypothetical protein
MKRPSYLTPALATLLLSTALSAQPTPAKPVVVHEWGTFTTLQTPEGKELGGLNVDDEPVPEFVHQSAQLVSSERPNDPPQKSPSGGTMSAVTLRLETPVLYFHLPEKLKQLTVDVDVRFKGGWLTQYYPDAKSVSPGLAPNARDSKLSPDTLGTLTWKGLKVGGSRSGPNCNDAVWNAPRQVSCQSVETPKGESEKFLFYRGVGNLSTPLKVVRNKNSVQLKDQNSQLRQAWLVNIGPGGCDFQELPDLRKKSSSTIPANLKPENLPRLKEKMRLALIADGLNADEAAAMLAAWNESYFQNPGLRVFYLLPQKWTDQVLPLKITSSDPKIQFKTVRTMLGRVEMISPEHEVLFKKLTSGDQTALTKMGRFRASIMSYLAKPKP